MSFVANRFTVVLDANVLVASRKRDLLLWFSFAGLFRARWSAEILTEMNRALEKSFGWPEEKSTKLTKTLSQKFPQALVSNHQGLANIVELPDENDRHVVSAAVRCGAQIIVTDNVKDFPVSELARLDIDVLSADDFLTETFDLFRIEGIRVLQAVRSRYSNPSMSQSEFLMDLRAKGLPRLAAELSEMKGLL